MYLHLALYEIPKKYHQNANKNLQRKNKEKMTKHIQWIYQEVLRQALLWQHCIYHDENTLK